ncbi:hypothetical protein FGE12_03505 [Aggregicoccus sp. 17bor-14]|uniref:hypothetical protein n=1 Tax=Myxococcaceae TaxID=31 RepID=UPI0012F40F77|nr:MULTISPECIES: hypothetical protein [Myxococcaceae]MBF5041439.1 hypothetical protein [Simulacricoccus sp. 17bor-14]MRI87223.1 hypothetical protein [Aggregicoccus sp. 17bor-14]
MTRLFLPQTQLEEWVLADKADLQDGQLVVTGEPTRVPVVPAVHFVKLVSGADEHTLLAKVKTEPQLQGLGAEQMADSVLLGEAAYEVVPGYVAEVAGPAAAPRKDASEADLLAAFLLNKMG